MQVATAKKDSAAAFCSADARFFPHMQSCSGYDGEHAATAATKVFIVRSVVHIFWSIHATTMGANITVSQSNHLLEI
jgi:hypothetical protein